MDDLLYELGELQHGVFGIDQVKRLPMPLSTVSDLERRGLLAAETPRVFRWRGAPRTALQRVSIGVLDAGSVAVASYRTAAWLWRLPGFDSSCIEVTWLRGRTSRGPTLAERHRPRLLLPHHVTAVDGIAVTSLARTVFDLAGALPPGRTERLVDNVVSRSPAMLAVLHRTLDELAIQGRTGITLMRQLLAERPTGTRVVASGLEARFEAILRAAGELPMTRQVDVGGEEWIGRVDFCDRELALLVEVDSGLHHTSLLDERLDAIRDEALTAAGWRGIVRIREAWIWYEPWRAVAAVRQARAELRQAAA